MLSLSSFFVSSFSSRPHHFSSSSISSFSLIIPFSSPPFLPHHIVFDRTNPPKDGDDNHHHTTTTAVITTCHESGRRTMFFYCHHPPPRPWGQAEHPRQNLRHGAAPPALRLPLRPRPPPHAARQSPLSVTQVFATPHPAPQCRPSCIRWPLSCLPELGPSLKCPWPCLGQFACANNMGRLLW